MFDSYKGYWDNGSNETPKFRQRVFPGHVLDVCLDKESPLYENPRDIGKIRFRDLANISPIYQRAEDQVFTVAWPLDRSIARYPLPGEQVMIYNAHGDVVMPLSNNQQIIFFYTIVVSTNHTISSNQSPFLFSNEYTITAKKPVSIGEAEIRFDKKLKDVSTFREGTDVKIYKQIQPLEGDFILQGRFGNSIRFGSTSTATADKGPWKLGKSGDPVLVLRVDGEYTTTVDDMYVSEDVNADDASIYMTSTQVVEATLQCTKEMKSWRTTYNIEDSKNDNLQDRVPTTSQLYTKLVDTSKPPEQAHQGPTTDQEVQDQTLTTSNEDVADGPPPGEE